MNIYDIPVYTKFGTQNIPMYVQIVQDDALLSFLYGYNAGQIQSWSDITENNPCDKVNSWLGANLLNPKLRFYRAKVSTDPADGLAQWGPCYDWINAATGICKTLITNVIPTNDSNQYDEISSVNATEIDYGGSPYIDRLSGGYDALSNPVITGTYNDNFSCAYLFANTGASLLQFSIYVAPSDIFDGQTINPKYLDAQQLIINSARVDISITFDNTAYNVLPTYAKTITISYAKVPTYQIANPFRDFTLKGALVQDYDLDNPYSYDGTSVTGGGNGTLGPGGLDSIDPAEIPNLPSISAADLGFITMYNPTVQQLKDLSDFMWSNLFDINTYKKLFSDPMESIIGLAIVPVAPSIGGSKNVHFGTIDSGVNMSYLSTNYVQLDCGSVDVERYIGCFMDNDPYTKISIYLPFIGIRQISADDVIGGSIHVVYNIDVLTGACACFIEHNSRGVLYSYNGSCITNVPLTSVNFSGAIQNAVTAVGSAIGMAAGMATGAAPLTAMGVTGLMTSAANTALNSKPQVQRSGNLGGSAGIMSILTPYVIIERPNISVPDHVQQYAGQTSNIAMNLGECSGFTMCEYVHLDNLNATSEELVEIESMLKAGVIL